MNVLIIGAAGLQGARLARILNRRPWVSGLILADRDVEKCRQVAGDVDHVETKVVEIDIKDHGTLVELIKGADVVCNFVGPYFFSEPLIVPAAIEAGKGYVDICDDYMVVDIVDKYDEAAREAGVAIVCGAGCSPGLTNVWARKGADQLESVNSITVYLMAGSGVWGAGSLQHMIAYYDTYNGKIPIVTRGEKALVTPGGDGEAVLFPKPAGEQQVYLMGHAEPVMLHRNLMLMNGAQEISVKGVLGDGTELIELVLGAIDMGLTKKNAICLLGQMVSPYDLLLEYLGSNAFAQSSFLQRLGEASDRNIWSLELKVSVVGIDNGKPVEIEYRLTGEDREMSIPETAAIAAELITEGSVTKTGVLLPENLDPSLFLSRLSQYVHWEEEWKYDL